MRPCPKCGEGAPAGARFCSACGAALEAGAPPQGELRKVVTIVFCDLSGSTSLGEQLDPESVRRMVTRFFDAMKAALERHGGTVEKFIGDAVMAVFGVPVVHEDDALRAVRAVGEMRAALDDLNEQLDERFGVRLQVRTGVNTGEVIAGDPSQGHGFVTGDAVNVASRLEQAAPDGEVLLGEGTVQLVRDAVEAEPVADLAVKGKSEPVRAFRLVGLKGAGPGPSRDAPMVGRDRELALLREAFDRSAAGAGCELVTIVGAPGLGKSRLAAEFAASLEGRATVVTGRCLSYGEGLTFWPVREVVETLAGIDDGNSAEEAQAALGRLLPADDDRATIVERVAGAVGLSAAAASPAEVSLGGAPGAGGGGRWAAGGAVRGRPLGRADLPRPRGLPGPDRRGPGAAGDGRSRRPAGRAARAQRYPGRARAAGRGREPRTGGASRRRRGFGRDRREGARARARATRCSSRSWCGCWSTGPGSRSRPPSTPCWPPGSRTSPPPSARWPRRPRWWDGPSGPRRRSGWSRAATGRAWRRACSGWSAGDWCSPTAGASPGSGRSASSTC